MAKTQKPNEEDKIAKETIEKRFKNMFSGENQPLSNMSLKEAEALKARVAELEALVAEQPEVRPESERVAPAAEPAFRHLLSTPIQKTASDQQESDFAASLQKRIITWVAGVSAAVGLAFFCASLYIVLVLQGGIPELPDQILMPFTVVMFVVNLIAIRLARQDRLELAAWLSYLISAITAPLLVILVLKNFYVAMGGILVLFSILFVGLVLPGKARLPGTLVAFGGLLSIIGIEAWDPAFRMSAQHLPEFTTLILVPAAIGILVIFIIVQQIKNPKIQSRLIVTLSISMALVFLGISFLVSAMSRQRIEAGALTELQGTSLSMATNVTTWLELNRNALQELTMLPAIVSMDPEQQRPALQAMAKAYPYMYLVSTTDLRGFNIARNDTGKLTDYSDREWFQSVKSGAPVSYQTLIGRTSGQPALVIAMPIKDAAGRTVGVAMFAADLTDLARETQATMLGEGGFTFLVDANNETLTHPDPEVTAELRDMSEYPPIVALRQGEQGMIVTTDSEGNKWLAYGVILDNGWAVIAQRPEDEILRPAVQFQNVIMGLTILGAALLSVIIWLTTRRLLKPISVLTSTASAIAAGDLNRVAEVHTRDELGTLANTFNGMTSQLHELIGNLEQRVADRTHDLELAAEVGRTVTAKVTHLTEMLSEAAETIRARFNLYYTQIYLTDPSGEKLILRAGTGEVGRQLLQRDHMLTVNSASLNGRAVLEKKVQIVANTKESQTFLPNPLLPNTRSEMCIPLIADEKVVGVLDMQSEQPGALSDSNLAAFEALAGQIAIAIQNAALFAEAQELLREVEMQMSRFTQQGWDDFLNAIHKAEKIGFAFDNSRVTRLSPETLTKESREDRFNMPLTIAGSKVGEIQVPADLRPNELELVKAVGDQLAQHVENLRLLAQAELFRKEAELAVRRLTHEGWETYLNAMQSDIGYVYDLNQVQPCSENSHSASDEMLKQPLVIREQTIGELNLDLPKASNEDMEIISAVAQQLSSHLETLRLSALNEKHAQREQTLRQLTSALRSSTNPTTIVRTAVREVGRILGRKTIVQVISPEQAGQAETVLGNGNETDSPADRS